MKRHIFLFMLLFTSLMINSTALNDNISTNAFTPNAIDDGTISVNAAPTVTTALDDVYLLNNHSNAITRSYDFDIAADETLFSNDAANGAINYTTGEYIAHSVGDWSTTVFDVNALLPALPVNPSRTMEIRIKSNVTMDGTNRDLYMGIGGGGGGMRTLDICAEFSICVNDTYRVITHNLLNDWSRSVVVDDTFLYYWGDVPAKITIDYIRYEWYQTEIINTYDLDSSADETLFIKAGSNSAINYTSGELIDHSPGDWGSTVFDTENAIPVIPVASNRTLEIRLKSNVSTNDATEDIYIVLGSGGRDLCAQLATCITADEYITVTFNFDDFGQTGTVNDIYMYYWGNVPAKITVDYVKFIWTDDNEVDFDLAPNVTNGHAYELYFDDVLQASGVWSASKTVATVNVGLLTSGNYNYTLWANSSDASITVKTVIVHVVEFMSNEFERMSISDVSILKGNTTGELRFDYTFHANTSSSTIWAEVNAIKSSTSYGLYNTSATTNSFQKYTVNDSYSNFNMSFIGDALLTDGLHNLEVTIWTFLNASFDPNGASLIELALNRTGSFTFTDSQLAYSQKLGLNPIGYYVHSWSGSNTTSVDIPSMFNDTSAISYVYKYNNANEEYDFYSFASQRSSISQISTGDAISYYEYNASESLIQMNSDGSDLGLSGIPGAAEVLILSKLTGAAISDVTVKFTHDSSGISKTAKTDSTGYAQVSFDNVENGDTVTIEISKANWWPTVKTAVFVNGGFYETYYLSIDRADDSSTSTDIIDWNLTFIANYITLIGPIVIVVILVLLVKYRK